MLLASARRSLPLSYLSRCLLLSRGSRSSQGRRGSLGGQASGLEGAKERHDVEGNSGTGLCDGLRETRQTEPLGPYPRG